MFGAQERVPCRSVRRAAIPRVKGPLQATGTVCATAPGPENTLSALKMPHANSRGPTSSCPKAGHLGPGSRRSLRQLPTLPLPPRHEGLWTLTVSVDEDVHGLHRHLLLHGRLGPTDDLQHRAVLLGSHPVDYLSLSAALETKHRYKVRKLLGSPPPPRQSA